MSLLPDSDGGISAQEQTQAIVNNGSEEESAVRRNKKLNDLEERWVFDKVDGDGRLREVGALGAHH